MPPTTAARCRISCGRADSIRRRTSPSRRRSQFAFRGTMTSRHPRAIRSCTTCEPRKPAPPVTSTRRLLQNCPNCGDVASLMTPSVGSSRHWPRLAPSPAVGALYYPRGGEGVHSYRGRGSGRPGWWITAALDHHQHAERHERADHREEPVFDAEQRPDPRGWDEAPPAVATREGGGDETQPGDRQDGEGGKGGD